MSSGAERLTQKRKMTVKKYMLKTKFTQHA